jgi:hypothetical protein
MLFPINNLQELTDDGLWELEYQVRKERERRCEDDTDEHDYVNTVDALMPLPPGRV